MHCPNFEQNLTDNELTSFSTALRRAELKYTKEFASDNIKLQVISRQRTLLHHFSSRPSSIQTLTNEKCTPQSLLKVILTDPIKLINKFSSHIYNRVSIWAVTFLTEPENISAAISRYYINDDEKLKYFAYVTFPAIFHHFKTDEMHKSAAALVANMITSQPTYIANVFLVSFLRSSSNFFEALWYNYDYIQANDEEKDIYLKLKGALEQATVCLTKSQTTLIEIFMKKSKTNFGRVIFGRLFLRSYLETHEGQESSITAKFLIAIGLMVRSTQFLGLYNELIKPKFSLLKIQHTASQRVNQTPIILSPHELLYLQRLVQKSPEIFDYPVNEPIRLQIKDTCEGDFEQLYFDLDLTLQFMPNLTMIHPELFQNEDRDQNEGLMASFEVLMAKEANRGDYLMMIDREKFSRSLAMKWFSKLLLEEPEPKVKEVVPWYYFPNSKINSIKKENIQPTIDSKVFRYSLHNLLNLVDDDYAKLWIYLRSYAKCDRGNIAANDYLKVLKRKENAKTQNENEHKIVKKVSAMILEVSGSDRLNTVSLISKIGNMLLQLSIHFNISSTDALQKCLSIAQNRDFVEGVIWCRLLTEYVPEIKKYMPSNMVSGLDFIIEALEQLAANAMSDESDESSDDLKINSFEIMKKSISSSDIRI